MRVIKKIASNLLFKLAEKLATPPQSDKRELVDPRLTPAPGTIPTADFTTFRKQITKLPTKGSLMIPHFHQIADGLQYPMCYDYLIAIDIATGEVKSNHRMYIFKNNQWVSYGDGTYFDGVLEGVVDEIVQAAASRGWNCSVGASDIAELFVGNSLGFQYLQRNKGSRVDSIRIQYQLPFKEKPPKISVRIFDPDSKVTEHNTPIFTIPFFKARSSNTPPASSKALI